MKTSITKLTLGHMLSLMLGLTLAILLAGCGGSGGGASADTSMSATPSSNGGGMDAFLAEVSRVLGMTSDTTEPSATDQINATTPEDKEAAPVG